MDSNPTDVIDLRGALTCSHALRQWSAMWKGRAAEVRRASRGLRQQARMLQGRYQYWRQRYLLIECTWCEKSLRWRYMDKPLVDVPPTSHGICPTCFEIKLRELHRRKP